MSKVIFFNRSIQKPADAVVVRPLACKAARPAARSNPLFAVWHKNPFTGKLECLWAADRAGRDQDEASLRAG